MSDNPVLLRMGDFGNTVTTYFLMFRIFKRVCGAYTHGDSGGGGGDGEGT